MKELKEQMERELLENILPFWMNRAVDPENGGFYGQIHNNLTIVKQAPRGGVLNARILWTFATSYRLFGKQEYLQMADRAYAYLTEKLLDKEYGGIYWLVDFKGKPLETKKQIYAQAFAVYGLSEYYRATGSVDALNHAIRLFRLIEENSGDPAYGGYFEACDRKWTRMDAFLDEKCGKEKKSMNTMLHIIEAYTNLYRVWKDEGLRCKLQEGLEVMAARVYDKDSGHFKLFFDDQWNSIVTDVSYGHDIEGSWLLSEAAQVLEDDELISVFGKISVIMAETTLREGIGPEGAVLYEGGPEGVKDHDRHWWPQAEGVVGFVNAYKLTGRKEFLDTARRIWQFTKELIIDSMNGEWFWGVTGNGEIMKPDAKVDMWKCPYHNSRACMEILKRSVNSPEA